MLRMVIVISLVISGMAVTAKRSFSDELLFTVDECRHFSIHQPDTNVNYQPGIDVTGRPVVEADLTPQINVTPDEIKIPVMVAAAEYIGLPVPPGVQIEQAVIGVLTVRDGEVLYNGEPLNGEAVYQLRKYCGQQSPPSNP